MSVGSEDFSLIRHKAKKRELEHYILAFLNQLLEFLNKTRMRKRAKVTNGSVDHFLSISHIWYKQIISLHWFQGKYTFSLEH